MISQQPKNLKKPLRKVALGCFLTISLSLAVSACGGADGETPAVLGATTAAASNNPRPIAAATKVPVFAIFSKATQGLVTANLIAENAIIADANYTAIVFNVGSASADQIIKSAESALDDSKIVILDSDGSDEKVSILKEITSKLAGANLTAVAVSIERNADGSNTVITLVPEAKSLSLSTTLEASTKANPGNTVKNVLLN